jgi:hypothetical protein
MTHIIQLYLALDLVPIFIPPWELGFQATMEGFSSTFALFDNSPQDKGWEMQPFMVK